jgi:hypothetical protein
MRLCEEKGQICANRLTDPYFSKPCANRYFIFLNSLANSAHFKEPNVRSMAVSETAAVLLRFLSNKAKHTNAPRTFEYGSNFDRSPAHGVVLQLHVRFGSVPDILGCLRDVRFAPKADISACNLKCPLRAKCRHQLKMRRLRQPSQSSSASATDAAQSNLFV